MKSDKDLKLILSMTGHGKKGVNADTIPLPHDRIQYLISKGYLSATPLEDGRFKISVTDTGITYFADKADMRRKWFSNNIIAILSLLVAVIALIRTF